VLLALGNGLEFVEWYYAALLAGGVVAAANPALKAPELAAIERDFEPSLLVLPDGVLRKAAPPTGDPRIAVVQYTSGTTGEPKGAMMSHANLVANALQNARWFGWTGEEVVLGNLPFCHTWGMCICLNSTFACGATLALPGDLGTTDAVERFGATVLYGSATQFHRLLALPAEDARKLATLRHCKAGAMLTQGNLKERWDAFCPWAPLQQGYGLTEASPESHDNPPERFRPGTVGVPLQDTDCRICDPADPGRALPPGEAGEVQLRGPQVTLGYWKRPEATEAAFHDGWLRTGDLGVMDADGYLRIVDRLKDLIKFRGWSVHPGNVEERLLRHPAVAEAAVVGLSDPVDGEVPVAFVVLRDPATAEELQAHCAAGLAPFETPRLFRVVDAIPRNLVGKPLRRLLRDRLNRA